MVDPAILFAKPKTITDTDKKALRAIGVVIVEVPDPNDVKLVRPTAALPSSDLLAIACDVISNHGVSGTREAFAKRVCEQIMEQNTRGE